MLEKIRLRKPLDQKVAVGDMITYQTTSFIIINILDVGLASWGKESIFAVYTCLVQQLNSPNLSENYTTTQTELAYELNEQRNISRVGDIIYDENTGIWVQVNAILAIRYEDEKIYVKYEFDPIPEWSPKEISKLQDKRRLQLMKLVKHEQKRWWERSPLFIKRK